MPDKVKCRCQKNADYRVIFVYDFGKMNEGTSEITDLCKPCCRKELVEASKDRSSLLTQFRILGKYKED